MIDDQSRDALALAGIHTRYYEMTLNEYQEAKTFIDEGHAQDVFQRNRGLVVAGVNDARTVAVLMGRWFLLSDWSVKVVTLAQLSRLLHTEFEDDAADLAYVMTCDVLVVLDMLSGKTCPLTYRERQDVQDHVRLCRDKQKVVVMHVEGQNMDSWWDASFVQFVRQDFKVLSINNARDTPHG